MLSLIPIEIRFTTQENDLKKKDLFVDFNSQEYYLNEALQLVFKKILFVWRITAEERQKQGTSPNWVTCMTHLKANSHPFTQKRCFTLKPKESPRTC